MAWVAGKRLQGGKYTIESELGRGRFGITYLVTNRNGDRLVVKTLNDVLLQSLSQSERERLENMFLQEAVKLAKCKHKDIVQVAEVFREGEYPCLVIKLTGKRFWVLLNLGMNISHKDAKTQRKIRKSSRIYATPDFVAVV